MSDLRRVHSQADRAHMAKQISENTNSPLELRFKRWTAVAVVCFLGLLAALPFRSAPQASGPTIAPSHRERSLRFRAEAASEMASRANSESESQPPRNLPSTTTAERSAVQNAPKNLALSSPEPEAESPVETRVSPVSAAPAIDAPRACLAKRGETLMDIAERALGDRRRWRELMALNPEHRSAFDELAEGEEVLLPERQ